MATFANVAINSRQFRSCHTHCASPRCHVEQKPSNAVFIEKVYVHNRCSLTSSAIPCLTRSPWFIGSSRPFWLKTEDIAHIRWLTRKRDACLFESGSRLRRFRERSPPTTRTRNSNDKARLCYSFSVHSFQHFVSFCLSF